MSRHRNRGKSQTVDYFQNLNQQIDNPEAPVRIVAADGLAKLNPRPSLPTYIRQLWQRRFFIGAEARSKALRSTRDYRLWRTWLVVNPILDVAFYGFLFGVLFQTSRGIENFLGYLIIGIMYMRMMSSLMGDGSGLITKSKSMIRTFAFPRASLIFSQALRALIDNILPAVVALILAFLAQWGKFPHWSVLLVIPLFLLIHIFGCGLMLITARLTAEIPDVKAIMPLATRAWFFLSGVMFSLDRFSHVPVVQELMSHNPAYIFLTAIRDSSIYQTVPDLNTWLILLAWTFGSLFVGFIYFWGAEDKYVRLA